MGCTSSNQICEIPIQLKDNLRNRLKSLNKKRLSLDIVNLILENVKLLEEKLNQEEINFAIDRLMNHELFSYLSRRECRVICQEMVKGIGVQNEYIFEQGDNGTSFFLIYEGVVDVEIDQKFVKRLAKGAIFGELALLFKCSRRASIICKSPVCRFLIMKPANYKNALKKMKIDQFSKNMQNMNQVPILKILTNKQKAMISQNIKIVTFNEGETIFQAGDYAQTMYIISEGVVKISIQGKQDIKLVAPQIFGESCISGQIKRSGTACAVTKVVCSLINHLDLQVCLGQSINNLVFYNRKRWVLMRSNLFEQFIDKSYHHRIITQFSTFMAYDGEAIDTNKYNGFIICLEGTINKKDEPIIWNFQNFRNSNTKTTLIKNGDGYCCYLSFQRFQQLIIETKLKNLTIKTKSSIKTLSTQDDMSLNDFRVIRKLGSGSFGHVYLVKNTQYGTNLYAIKCISKSLIRSSEMQAEVIEQKQILEKTIFPYIVGYLKAYQTKSNIFLLMEYIQGIQMYQAIREINHMSDDIIRYYFGCLLVSIEYLHSQNIVYRDLKPENAIVDVKGKVHLIDLGTAKQLNSDNFYKTFTIIGTPHYMAPEAFLGNGYSFEVDLWSLGVLLYEFFCFKLPFGENVTKDPFAVFTEIKKKNLVFPKYMKNQPAKAIISGLLNKNSKKRSAMNFQTIKKSTFYQTFNWKDLLQQKIDIPYVPKNLRQENCRPFIESSNQIQFLKYFYQSERNLIEQWNSQVSL